MFSTPQTLLPLGGKRRVVCWQPPHDAFDLEDLAVSFLQAEDPTLLQGVWLAGTIGAALEAYIADTMPTDPGGDDLATWVERSLKEDAWLDERFRPPLVLARGGRIAFALILRANRPEPWKVHQLRALAIVGNVDDARLPRIRDDHGEVLPPLLEAARLALWSCFRELLALGKSRELRADALAYIIDAGLPAPDDILAGEWVDAPALASPPDDEPTDPNAASAGPVDDGKRVLVTGRCSISDIAERPLTQMFALAATGEMVGVAWHPAGADLPAGTELVTWNQVPAEIRDRPLPEWPPFCPQTGTLFVDSIPSTQSPQAGVIVHDHFLVRIPGESPQPRPVRGFPTGAVAVLLSGDWPPALNTQNDRAQFALSFLATTLGPEEARKLSGLPLVVARVGVVSPEVHDLTTALQMVGLHDANERQLMSIGPTALQSPLTEVLACLIL